MNLSRGRVINKLLRPAGHVQACLLSTESGGAIKSFDEIPGPRGPLGLGNIFQYIPGIGRYSFDELHRSGEDKYAQYGPIVRETMVPGQDVVWLFDPTDIATIMDDRTPGIFPSRRSHTALEKYRKDRPNVYRTAGLLPTNGPEWWKIRSELQKGLSSPQSVRNFLPATDKITKELVERIMLHGRDRDSKAAESDAILVEDFMPTMSRLNLELVCLLAFDVQLDSFSEEQMQPSSLSSRLMDSAATTNNCILPTDQGFQLWRYFETPTYRRLRKAQQFMEKTAIELVSQKLLSFNEDQQRLASGEHGSKSLIEDYLRNPNLEVNDIIGMASDLLLAGVHTTSYANAFVLYHLGLNVAVQERLYQEAKLMLPDPRNSIGAAALASEASYGRAVMKETLRLNPLSVGVGRILNRDYVLSGYHVPHGTVTVTQNMISCRQEKFFRDAHQFLPERWLRETREPVHPFLLLPFGHGMRSCIARRLAEQSMLVLMLRLVRSFKIEWAGTVPMDVKTHLINEPDQPIRLRFIPRQN